MAREKMTEIKIEVPERVANFINDIYKTLELDRDKEIHSWVNCFIDVDYAELDPVDRIRLVKKHKVDDLYPPSQWELDAAAKGMTLEDCRKEEEEKRHKERDAAIDRAMSRAFDDPDFQAKLAQAISRA